MRDRYGEVLINIALLNGGFFFSPHEGPRIIMTFCYFNFTIFELLFLKGMWLLVWLICLREWAWGRESLPGLPRWIVEQVWKTSQHFSGVKFNQRRAATPVTVRFFWDKIQQLGSPWIPPIMRGRGGTTIESLRIKTVAKKSIKFHTINLRIILCSGSWFVG